MHGGCLESFFEKIARKKNVYNLAYKLNHAFGH